MKAILEFDFDKEDSDDRSNFDDAINGSKLRLAVWEFDQWLRSQYKYMSDDAPDGAYDAYYKSREKLNEILNSEGLNLG